MCCTAKIPDVLLQFLVKEPQIISSTGTVDQDKHSTRSLSSVEGKQVPRTRRQSRDANRSFDKRRSKDRKARVDIGVGHSTMGSEELEKVRGKSKDTRQSSRDWTIKTFLCMHLTPIASFNITLTLTLSGSLRSSPTLGFLVNHWLL